MLIPFTKMHGLGNDFVLIDQRGSSFDLSSRQISAIADRRLGVGCDQVLVLAPTTMNDAIGRYQIFNADGSSAEHCGNGVRCVAKFLVDAGEVQHSVFSLEVNGSTCELEISTDGLVRVEMGAPTFDPQRIPIATQELKDRYDISVGDSLTSFGCVSMGNPHAVTVVDHVETASVDVIGKLLQDHCYFPSKVNVGFMQIVDEAHIRLRVFERGVGETRACGTGACAAVAVGRLWGELASVVEVELKGGTLEIEWSGRQADSLQMTGPACRVFDGTIEL